MSRNDANEFLETGSKLHALGGLDEALTYYQKALDYLKNSEDKKTEADTLLEIGNVYLERANYTNAEKYFKKALELYNSVQDDLGRGYAYTGLGLSEEKQEKFNEARGLYSNAVNIFHNKKDKEREAAVRALLGGTYESQAAWEDAIMEYNKAISIFEKLGEKDKEKEINSLISNISGVRSKSKTTHGEKIMIIVYLLALVTAEVLVAYVNIPAGLTLEGIILFGLLVNSSLDVSYNYAVMLRSMMILPMIRIIGLSIPLMQIQPLYWFPIIAVPLFAASYTIMKNQGLSRKHVGLIVGNLKVQVLVAMTGIFLGTIEYTILQPKPLIATLDPFTLITAAIILIVSTGFAEELLFRGILQKNAENFLGPGLGLLYTALLFTALHIGWHSFHDLIFVFCVALFYGITFQKTRSIVGVTFSHGISNSFLFLIIPFYAPVLFHLI